MLKEETVNRKDYLDTQELPNADPEVPCGHLSSRLRREIVEIESKPSDWTQEGYDELEPRITERLVVEPAKVYVLRTIRRVWKSKETNKIAPSPPPPPHVFDRCSVDESVIVHIILNRFLYHLPYYRQEKMFRLMDCPLSRDNMIQWCNDLAFLFAPIVDAIEREVKASRAVYIDETPFIGRPRLDTRPSKHITTNQNRRITATEESP